MSRFGLAVTILEWTLIVSATLWCLAACFYAEVPDSIRERFAHTFAWIVVLLSAAFCFVFPIDDTALASSMLLIIVIVWFSRLVPQDSKNWDLEYAVAPEAQRVGDMVLIRHIRNFRYRSRVDMTPSYYDASYNIHGLTSVDLVCVYWSGKLVSHVFLSFGFSDGRYLAVSVETRRRRGQRYSTIAGFFKHYQLSFVVADERDLIGVRTDMRQERAYIYRLRTSAEERNTLFGGYMDRVAKLARQPEYYNTLINNCTTNIAKIINAGVPQGDYLRWSWRLLLSGYADTLAYRMGRLESSIQFDELKRRSLVVRHTGDMLDANFSTSIRKGLFILPSQSPL